MEKEFNIDFDYRNITLESAKFIFSQAEKLLQSTVTTTNILLERAKVLIQMFATLIIANIGFVVVQINTNNFSLLFQVAVIFLAFLIICSWFSIKMFRVADVDDIGSRPSLLANQELLEFDKKNQELLLIVNEIENYEKRIKSNLANNRERVNIFHKLMNTFKAGILVLIIYLPLYYLVSLLGFCLFG